MDWDLSNLRQYDISQIEAELHEFYEQNKHMLLSDRGSVKDLKTKNIQDFDNGEHQKEAFLLRL